MSDRLWSLPITVIRKYWEASVNYVSSFRMFHLLAEIAVKYSKHTRVTLTVQDGPGKGITVTSMRAQSMATSVLPCKEKVRSFFFQNKKYIT